MLLSVPDCRPVGFSGYRRSGESGLDENTVRPGSFGLENIGRLRKRVFVIDVPSLDPSSYYSSVEGSVGVTLSPYRGDRR